MKVLKIIIPSAVLLTLIFFVSFDPKMFFLNKNRQLESTQNTSEIKSGIPTINPSGEASYSNKLHFKACVDYQIVARSGDSATTISRRAVNEYINEVIRMKIDNIILPSSPEERVYAENYLVKHLTINNLKKGDTVVVPCSLVEESFDKIKTLSQEDKKNISKYKIAENKYYEAGWIRVDGDFLNSNCEKFCISKGKVCSPLQCEPDPWCEAKGGMMEIETWDSRQGIVCDRKWEGTCKTIIDRPPPSYNFHCCCK